MRFIKSGTNKVHRCRWPDLRFPFCTDSCFERMNALQQSHQENGKKGCCHHFFDFLSLPWLIHIGQIYVTHILNLIFHHFQTLGLYAGAVFVFSWNLSNIIRVLKLNNNTSCLLSFHFRTTIPVSLVRHS